MFNMKVELECAFEVMTDLLPIGSCLWGCCMLRSSLRVIYLLTFGSPLHISLQLLLPSFPLLPLNYVLQAWHLTGRIQLPLHHEKIRDFFLPGSFESGT